MPLNTRFRLPFTAAEAYLAEPSAMPSRVSGSLVSSAQRVLSSSCTSVAALFFRSSTVFPAYAASSNTTTARTSSTIRFVFFMTFYPQNIVFARLLTIAIVYRIFIFHTRP